MEVTEGKASSRSWSAALNVTESEGSLKRQCELMDQLSLVSFRREVSKAYTENAKVVDTKAEPVQQRI